MMNIEELKKKQRPQSVNLNYSDEKENNEEAPKPSKDSAKDAVTPKASRFKNIQRQDDRPFPSSALKALAKNREPEPEDKDPKKARVASAATMRIKSVDYTRNAPSSESDPAPSLTPVGVKFNLKIVDFKEDEQNGARVRSIDFTRGERKEDDVSRGDSDGPVVDTTKKKAKANARSITNRVQKTATRRKEPDKKDKVITPPSLWSDKLVEVTPHSKPPAEPAAASGGVNPVAHSNPPNPPTPLAHPPPQTALERAQAANQELNSPQKRGTRSISVQHSAIKHVRKRYEMDSEKTSGVDREKRLSFLSGKTPNKSEALTVSSALESLEESSPSVHFITALQSLLGDKFSRQMFLKRDGLALLMRHLVNSGSNPLVLKILGLLQEISFLDENAFEAVFGMNALHPIAILVELMVKSQLDSLISVKIFEFLNSICNQTQKFNIIDPERIYMSIIEQFKRRSPDFTFFSFLVEFIKREKKLENIKISVTLVNTIINVHTNLYQKIKVKQNFHKLSLDKVLYLKSLEFNDAEFNKQVQVYFGSIDLSNSQTQISFKVNPWEELSKNCSVKEEIKKILDNIVQYLLMITPDQYFKWEFIRKIIAGVCHENTITMERISELDINVVLGKDIPKKAQASILLLNDQIKIQERKLREKDYEISRFQQQVTQEIDAANALKQKLNEKQAEFKKQVGILENKINKYKSKLKNLKSYENQPTPSPSWLKNSSLSYRYPLEKPAWNLEEEPTTNTKDFMSRTTPALMTGDMGEGHEKENPHDSPRSSPNSRNSFSPTSFNFTQNNWRLRQIEREKAEREARERERALKNQKVKSIFQRQRAFGMDKTIEQRNAEAKQLAGNTLSVPVAHPPPSNAHPPVQGSAAPKQPQQGIKAEQSEINLSGLAKRLDKELKLPSSPLHSHLPSIDELQPLEKLKPSLPQHNQHPHPHSHQHPHHHAETSHFESVNNGEQLPNEVEKLQKTVKKLNQELLAKVSLISELRKNELEYQKDKEHLSFYLEQYKKETEDYKREIENYEIDLEKLISSKKKDEELIREYTKQIYELSEENERYSYTFHHIAEENEELKLQAEELLMENIQIKKENSELLNDNRQLISDIAIYRKDNILCLEKIDALEEELKKKNNEESATKIKKKKSVKHISSISKDKNFLNEEEKPGDKKSNEAIEKWKSEAEMYRKRVIELEFKLTEMEESTRSIEQIEEEKRQIEFEMEDLEKQRIQLEALENEIKEKQKKIQQEEENVVQNRKKFLDLLEMENSRLEKKRNAITKENEKLEVETEKVLKRRAEMRAEYSILEAENEKHDNLREKVQAKILLLQERVAKQTEIKEHYKKDKLELEQEEKNLTKFKEELETMRNSLEEHLKDLEQKRKNYELQAEEVEQKRQTLEEEAEILAEMQTQLKLRKTEMLQEGQSIGLDLEFQ
eukprot:TRINITY_DN12289_c0_g1_i1.p1 TRINITY_DN12289_c0_g1~~TRINITY_DN12289_c0_g1_i1.p1  ORF type:complete len:1426 (-),score=501.96 TRINITY_DN12289_c0_g1_i1:128-4405(-)